MGLIGGIARTAVIAGTATAVSNNVSRRQANRWAQQDQAAQPQPTYEQPQYAQPAPPPPAAAPEEDVYDQIRKLGELKDAGILTDEEFAAKKAAPRTLTPGPEGGAEDVTPLSPQSAAREAHRTEVPDPQR